MAYLPAPFFASPLAERFSKPGQEDHRSTPRTIEPVQHNAARVAGFLCPFLLVPGIFAEFYARGRLIHSGSVLECSKEETKCQQRPSSSSSWSFCFCLAGSAFVGGAGRSPFSCGRRSRVLRPRSCDGRESRPGDGGRSGSPRSTSWISCRLIFLAQKPVWPAALSDQTAS